MANPSDSSNAPKHSQAHAHDKAHGKAQEQGLFDRYGEIYDDLYSHKDYAGESAYINQLLKASGNAPKTLLELGSGTGGHARELATLGYDVTGVERSASMIARAESHAGGPRYIQSDIRELALTQKYDAAISLFHVMSYITSTDDLFAIFKNVHAHLSPGGVFVFDFWYGPAVVSQPLTTRVVRMDTPKRTLCRINEPKLRSTQNVVDVHFEVWAREKADRTTEVIHEVHPMRFFFLPELEFLLKHAGFKTVVSHQWLSENEAPTVTDRNAVIRAQA